MQTKGHPCATSTVCARFLWNAIPWELILRPYLLNNLDGGNVLADYFHNKRFGCKITKNFNFAQFYFIYMLHKILSVGKK